MKGLIVGYEIMFRGPHTDSSIPPADISSLTRLLEAEGHDVGTARLSYLFNAHMDKRAERIARTRVETTLDAVVAEVLEELEIEAPTLISAMVEIVAVSRMAQFSPVHSCSELMKNFKEAGIKVGMVCNAPVGIPPQHIRVVTERSGMGGYIDDAQFSSENGMVRPHARPFRYSLSNLEVAAPETLVLTGIPREMDILNRLGFANVFMPEHDYDQGSSNAVCDKVLSEITRYV